MSNLINPYRFAVAGGGGLDDVPVTTNLYFWAKRGTGFYSDNGVTPATANGDLIRRWYDPRANGLYLVCGDIAVPGRHPRLDTVTKTSFSIARLETSSGNERYFLIPSLSGLTGGSEIYVVLKNNNDVPAAGKTGIWDIGNSGAQSHFTWIDGTIYDSLGSTLRRTVGNPTPDLATWNYYGGWSVTNDWAARLSGSSLLTSGTNTVGFSAAPKLGFSGGEYYDGVMAEFLVYSTKLSSGDRTSVESYLAAICAAA